TARWDIDHRRQRPFHRQCRPPVPLRSTYGQHWRWRRQCTNNPIGPLGGGRSRCDDRNFPFLNGRCGWKPGSTGLSYARTWTRAGWKDNYSRSLYQDGSFIRITRGGVSESFTQSGSTCRDRGPRKYSPAASILQEVHIATSNEL